MILIDGHNVFFALERDQSHHFERDLNAWKKECLSKCEQNHKPYILVFDGSGGGHPSGFQKKFGKKGRVVYSGNISADDWIENWVLFHKQEMIELITADVRLYEKIKEKRVKRTDPLAWWKVLKHIQERAKGRVSGQSSSGEKKSFGSTEEWLQFFGEK